MAKKIGYVFVMNKVSNRIAVRSFENNGNGELDYEVALNEAFREVCQDPDDDNCIWIVDYIAMTPERLSILVSNLSAYAEGGDDGWCDNCESLMSSRI